MVRRRESKAVRCGFDSRARYWHRKVTPPAGAAPVLKTGGAQVGLGFESSTFLVCCVGQLGIGRPTWP